MINNKKHKQKRQLTYRTSVKTLAIKIYDEQLPEGWDNTTPKIVAINKKEIQILAIKHDKDDRGDDFFAPSIEKPHYHIILRVVDNKPRHISTILNLIGIKFRQGLDDTLLREHALETIKHFDSYAAYLTHETEEAQADGKYLYPRDNIVSNLTQEEIDEVRDGYTRLTNGKHKADLDEMIALDKLAQQIGYELKDFDEWYHDLPLVIRSNSKMKQIRESYNYGIQKKSEENGEIIRTCIFIKGEPNTGKTYAAVHALQGKKILKVGGGGTGKFDKLKTTTDAIVIDDDVCPNLLNMSDNYICQAYRRGSNNPFWCGDYLIVTSNYDFDEWLKNCKISVTHSEAVRSRFYVCSVDNIKGTKKLYCESVCTRGTPTEQNLRKNKYIEFRDNFERIINAYTPIVNEVDYSDINDWAEIDENSNPWFEHITQQELNFN